MMPSDTMTVRKFLNDVKGTEFEKDYFSLFGLDQQVTLPYETSYRLLRVALLLLNSDDVHLQALGYRIVLRYANATSTYIPLHDVALAKGLIPVTKFIKEQHSVQNTQDNFSSLLEAAHIESFRLKDIYLTDGQKKMNAFHFENGGSVAIIAPTSYGKSEMFISRLKQGDYNSACIIVPTKALLSQTLKRLIAADVHELDYRLISHPDMYTNNVNKMICVVTQERLLRLMKKSDDILFDIVMIDEAHNLFESTDRAMLLAYVILILRKRNPDISLGFYSPFVADVTNLRLKHTEYGLHSFTVNESIKSEQFFIVENKDAEGILHYYDQFWNSLITLEATPGLKDIDFVFRYSGRKNIVYVNRPRDIEDIAMNMASELDSGDTVPTELEEVVNAVSDLFHEDYNLLECIRKGIAYHHGAMPDLVRLYVEYIFSSFDEFRYIIATATLLEGVNLPADKMFILSNMKGPRKLSPAQFKNLIGRVCRFSEIFSSQQGSLELLEPKIYLLNGTYTRSDANLENFLRDTAKVTKTINDDISNTMIKPDDELSSDEQNILQKKLEYLENIEPNTVKVENIRYATTPIGICCYRNCITEFDIFDNEEAITEALDHYNGHPPIDNTDDLLTVIYDLFLDNVTFTDKQQHDYRAFLRLTNLDARRFYAMFLSWRQRGSSYRLMITSFLNYWGQIEDPVIYVGTKWGDVKRNDTDLIPAYINVSEKTTAERVNYAIKKIKEEQDFVDNTLLRYVEVLYDMKMMDDDFYQRIKYGTNNPVIICLLKNGFSIDLARVITADIYDEFVYVDVDTDEVIISGEIEGAMVLNNENKVLIFEARFHINA